MIHLYICVHKCPTTLCVPTCICTYSIWLYTVYIYMLQSWSHMHTCILACIHTHTHTHTQTDTYMHIFSYVDTCTGIPKSPECDPLALCLFPYLQMLCLGVRNIHKALLFSVDSPLVELECGGHRTRMDMSIKSARDFPNFPKPLLTMDAVSWCS